MADKIATCAFWFVIGGVRAAIKLYREMPGEKYRMTKEGRGIMPMQMIDARRGAGEFVTLGAVVMLEGDAQALVSDASLGAFLRELVAADDARKKEKKDA